MPNSHAQTVYLNGHFLPMTESQISTQDRGFLFGDGVYEVIPVYQQQLFEFEAHLQRLKNSLIATQITNPLSDTEWKNLLDELIARHPWQDQFIYLQVTRGIQMTRDHLPADNLTPTVYAYTNPLKPVAEQIIEHGIKVVTLEDIRWLRCDIKAITLLPNVMLKLAAKAQGADDAILVSREGLVTEGSASNVFVIKNGVLMTPPNGHKILPGITRMVIEKLAEQHNMPLIETDLSAEDLKNADELWLTSSTKEALPITYLDGQPVGTGRPGKIWQLLRQHYQVYKTECLAQHA